MDYTFNILVVGCGGTGGNYIKELGRYLYSLGNARLCRIVLIDGDVVEERNVTRQPFLPEDVGRKKAEVMAEILQSTFDVDCSYYTEYIERLQDLEAFMIEDSVTILVGCVDNHPCRKIMHEFYIKRESCFYLDSANEYSVGEVVAGVRIGGCELYPDRAFYYPEVLGNDYIKKSEESCTDLNVSIPQHLVTNLMASCILLMNTAQILSKNVWSGGIYYFDTFKGYCQLKGQDNDATR